MSSSSPTTTMTNEYDDEYDDRKRPYVLTIGTFDLFHAGHSRFLRGCRRLAGNGIVVVGVNDDEFVALYKGERPIIPFEQRLEVVKHHKGVDYALRNTGPGVEMIRRLRPAVLAIGTDWAHRDYFEQVNMTALEMREADIQLVYIPYSDVTSSTSIREACRHRDRYAE